MAAPPAERPASQNSSNLGTLWTELIERVASASAFTKSYLIEAHPVSLANKVLTIGFDPEFADHLGLVDNSRTHALLQTKLSELGHPSTQVKFIKAEAPPGWKNAPEPAPAPPPPTPVAPAKTAAPAAAASATAPAPVASPAKPKPESKPFNKDDFKNDPLIQKALEVFKGEIVDIRS